MTYAPGAVINCRICEKQKPKLGSRRTELGPICQDCARERGRQHPFYGKIGKLRGE